LLPINFLAIMRFLDAREVSPSDEMPSFCEAFLYFSHLQRLRCSANGCNLAALAEKSLIVR